ncbi:unnamed protein product [Rhizophagus irregularis]|nr:unnamed protein product [Rhizophagus irregularis]
MICDNCGLQLNVNGVVLEAMAIIQFVTVDDVFISWKETDTLTQDNLDDEINEEEVEESEETADEEIDVFATLTTAINNINYW